MSSQDYEVMRKVWELRIPVQFRLDHDVGHHTEPYFTMLSRSTYFPLVMREVIAHFNTMTNDLDPSSAWLECDGTALKWNYPIGVLYDMLTVQEHTPYLPWAVTVKLSSPPSGFSVKVGADSVEANFMHSVKEADCLKHERMIMKEMKMQEHKQMWEGLMNDRFDQFWEVNKKLCGDMKYMPMRFYEKDAPFKQIRIAPNDENGARRTLADCVKCLKGADVDVSAFELVSYGVVLPPDASAQWLARNYAYPDNFVHVALVSKQERN